MSLLYDTSVYINVPLLPSQYVLLKFTLQFYMTSHYLAVVRSIPKGRLCMYSYIYISYSLHLWSWK